jgi:RimJ/RimL family protein N-acetyltransferase
MRHTIRTERLLLRRWREADRLPFQKVNADPRVMEFLPAPLSPGESGALIERIKNHFVRHGFGSFAAELLEDATFAGFIGLSIPTFDAPFMPAVEVGWRLAFDCWGSGIGDRRRARCGPLRIRGVGPRQCRLLHSSRKPALPARDGKDRHDA